MVGPTHHVEVNTLADALRAKVESILGEQLVGIYLHGSLASGDFDPARSDIDMLVVTDGDLAEPQVAALREMHAQLARSGLRWAGPYEVSYIPLRAIRRHDPNDCMHVALAADGTFGVDRHGSDWIIQRHILRDLGITLVGPPPHTLIDPVTAEDMRLAVKGILQEWWRPHLLDPSRLRKSDYQAFAILTMCRALHTLETGTAGSKPQAVRWAKEHLPAQWSDLIDTGIAWRYGDALDRLSEVMAFIQYTLQTCEART